MHVCIGVFHLFHPYLNACEDFVYVHSTVSRLLQETTSLRTHVYRYTITFILMDLVFVADVF